MSGADRVASAIASVGVDGFTAQHPGEVGGQQDRVPPGATAEIHRVPGLAWPGR
jgi:hypothetical protein